jgi:ankyrin repeat protein
VNMRLPLLLFSICLGGCALGVASLPPIIGAARDGDTGQLTRLLEAGADPNLRAGLNDWTPLMHAIHKNRPQSVRVLLTHGARVNERGGRGVTALIMAAGYGYDGIVKMLLDAGASVSTKADDGADALSAAVGGVPDIDRFTVGHCQNETVRTLLDASPGLRLASDSVALRVAKFRGCSQVVAMVQPAR